MPRDQDIGPPVPLGDGQIITDGGQLVFVQYIDIGDEKRDRPRILVKATQSQFALEYSPTLRLSTPSRFRDLGETFIKDDQEGKAYHEDKTELPAQTDEEKAEEQKSALSLLGAKDVSIGRSTATRSHRDTESTTFGRSSWIYCTSMLPLPEQKTAWREHLPANYDHQTTIRQPTKFAQALGLMFVDTVGAQGQRGTLTHDSTLKSFHDTQIIIHGPVWYTDDVLGFLQERQSDSRHILYPLFVKDSRYRAQREYRFVIHCETPVPGPYLDLPISGMMRDAFAPIRFQSPVQFESPSQSETSTPLRVTGPTPKSRTTTRTKRTTENHRWTVRAGDDIRQDETLNREQVITLTNETDVGTDSSNETGGAAPAVARLEESETRRTEVDGVPVERSRMVRTKVVYVPSDEHAGEFFDLSEDGVEQILEAIHRPFTDFPNLPVAVSKALTDLAENVHDLSPEHEIQAMSACWNAVWAISNLCACFGDVVDSVSIQHDVFVAVELNKSTPPESRAKLLIGPRGTFALLLTSGERRRYMHGGEENRLWIFPDEATVDAFTDFGWQPEVANKSQGT